MTLSRLCPLLRKVALIAQLWGLCGSSYASDPLAEKFEFLQDQIALNRNHSLSNEEFFTFNFKSSLGFLKTFSETNKISRQGGDSTTRANNLASTLNAANRLNYQSVQLRFAVPLPYWRFGRLKSISNISFKQQKDVLLQVIPGASPSTNILMQQRNELAYTTSLKYAGSPHLYFIQLKQIALKDSQATRDIDYLLARGELFTFEDATNSATLYTLSSSAQFLLNDFLIEASLEELPVAGDQSSLAFKRPVAYRLGVSQDLLLQNKYHFTPELKVHYRERVSMLDNISAVATFKTAARTTSGKLEFSQNFLAAGFSFDLSKIELNYHVDYFYSSDYKDLGIQHQFSASVPF